MSHVDDLAAVKEGAFKQSAVKQGTFKQAVFWLLFLAPIFYLTYNFANNYAASLDNVKAIVMPWEKHIPFLSWTIIPYWLENLFYGLAFFICANRRQVHRLGLRLLTVQMIACTCFIVFPLRFSFEQPSVTEGFVGMLFQQLGEFDKPFNQAPSLHIAILTVLSQHYLHRMRDQSPIFVFIIYTLVILIALSVLTTYQHHFIDIPTGFVLGIFALWLWPQRESQMLPFSQFQRAASNKKAGLAYLALAVLLVILAVLIKGYAWWLLWFALPFFIIASAYFFFGYAVFQKYTNGQHSFASRILFLPYFIGAKLNVYYWTHKLPAHVEVIAGLSVGRHPKQSELVDANWNMALDLCPEIAMENRPENTVYEYVPVLDLTVIDQQSLRHARDIVLEQINQGKHVLVFCALGFSRSCCVVLAVLLEKGYSLQEAQALLIEKRPQLVIKEEHWAVLRSLEH